MPSRPTNEVEAAEIFRTFARTQCSDMPMYERFSNVFADSDELTALVLIPPFPQRLPALVLAAFHYTAIEFPDDEIATIYPSVNPDAHKIVDECSDRELEGIFLRCFSTYKSRIHELLSTRALQTNEVNRSCAWRYALHSCPLPMDRPYSLVELGSSAGLNLSWDHYRMAFITHGDPLSMARRLACRLLPALPLSSDIEENNTFLMDLATSLNDIKNLPQPPVHRIGIDQHPLNANDPEDARWLQACVWPEQSIRFGRMNGAIEDAKDYPPNVVQGDYRTDLVDVISKHIPHDHDLVVLSSWALAYASRQEREEILEQLRGLARGELGEPAAPRRISMCTLEPARALSLLDTSIIEDELGEDFALGSVLGRTDIDTDGNVTATVLGHGQAHMNWFQPLREPVQTHL